MIRSGHRAKRQPLGDESVEEAGRELKRVPVAATEKCQRFFRQIGLVENHSGHEALDEN